MMSGYFDRSRRFLFYRNSVFAHDRVLHHSSGNYPPERQMASIYPMILLFQAFQKNKRLNSPLPSAALPLEGAAGTLLSRLSIDFSLNSVPVMLRGYLKNANQSQTRQNSSRIGHAACLPFLSKHDMLCSLNCVQCCYHQLQ